jgi:phospholipid/cholesterol/gamma-HCH transport system ATP-binding protein
LDLLSANKTFIELEGVYLEIAGEALLRDVHFALSQGEVVAVMGPSGQGKSLLLKVLAGLLEPTAGRVQVQGRDRRKMSVAEKKEWGRKTGMLFQRNALFDSLSVLENVNFPQLETLGYGPGQASERSLQLLKAVGLEDAAERHPSEISGGMQKRLGIARALSLAPQLILYDDPTAGLDPITSRMIIRLIKDLQEQDGSTVILVTNELARAFQIADRIGFVFGGRFIMAGTPEETRQSSNPAVAAFLRGQTYESQAESTR